MALLLLAVVGACGLAYLGNQAGLRLLGPVSVFTLTPWWEEACKMAVLLVLPGVVPLAVHALFGATEAIYTWRRSHDNGLFLGLMSFAGHGLFGGVFMLVAQGLGSLGPAYVLASLVHMLYNVIVLHMVLPSLGANPLR